MYNPLSKFHQDNYDGPASGSQYGDYDHPAMHKQHPHPHPALHGQHPHHDAHLPYGYRHRDGARPYKGFGRGFGKSFGIVNGLLNSGFFDNKLGGGFMGDNFCGPCDQDYPQPDHYPQQRAPVVYRRQPEKKHHAHPKVYNPTKSKTCCK